MNRWVWIAYYDDGTVVRQSEFNEATGKEWSSDHLDPDRLKALTLEPEFSKIGNCVQPRIILQFEKGTRFKRFWRTYTTAVVTVNEETNEETVENQVTVTWVVSIEKNGVTFYNFFRPNGEWVVSTNPEGSEYYV